MTTNAIDSLVRNVLKELRLIIRTLEPDKMDTSIENEFRRAPVYTVKYFGLSGDRIPPYVFST